MHHVHRPPSSRGSGAWAVKITFAFLSATANCPRSTANGLLISRGTVRWSLFSDDFCSSSFSYTILAGRVEGAIGKFIAPPWLATA
jgi:hypothetical protein